MMLWYSHTMGWWGYAGMAVLVAAFWILTIGGIAVLIRYLLADSAPIEPSSATSVLAARFASGEITEKEYRERMAVLDERLWAHQAGTTRGGRR